MQELDWDVPFHPAYGLVTMPKNMFVYYRGYDTSHPTISNYPSYYGSIITAKGYAELPGRTLGAFTNNKDIKLMDIRFMKDILRELFVINPPNNNDTFSVILSFGICSLQHQCILAEKRFKTSDMRNNLKSLFDYYNSNKKDNVEQNGCRIAETTNDACTMGFLSTFFDGFADGFISPRQYSPFHIEKKNSIGAEMIIFNPIKSGITMTDFPVVVVPPKSIEWLYGREFGTKIHLGKPHFETNIYIKSGGGHIDTILPSVEQIQYEWYTNPEIQTNWANGQEAGRRWKSISQFGFSTNPHPIASELGDWNDILTPTRKTDFESTPTILSKLDECLILLKSMSEGKRRLTRKITSKRN